MEEDFRGTLVEFSASFWRLDLYVRKKGSMIHWVLPNTRRLIGINYIYKPLIPDFALTLVPVFNHIELDERGFFLYAILRYLMPCHSNP